jgi:UDP-glucose 4-epimerase
MIQIVTVLDFFSVESWYVSVSYCGKKMKKIVITGGAGFIGAALANSLSKDSSNVVFAIDNLSTGNWDRVSSGVNKIDLDLTIAKDEDLSDVLDGADLVYHLSAVKLHNQNNSFDAIIQNNVYASQRVFEAAGVAKVKRVVFTSSLYAYGLPEIIPMKETSELNPITAYGASKVFGENLLKINSLKYGYSFGVARLFFIYGPNQFAEGGYKSVIISNFERIRKGIPATVTGDGEQILDYLYIEDCVEALKLLGNTDQSDTFNISSGEGQSILELTKVMLQVSHGDKFEFVESDWTKGTKRIGSNQKLREQLGWTPKVSILDGITRTWKSLGA